jgi:hypothetical protein
LEWSSIGLAGILTQPPARTQAEVSREAG